MKPIPSTVLKDAADTPAPLELERFLPYRLSVLSNRVSAAIARLYRDRFGIAIAEWRVMAVLGRFGAMTATELGQRTAMDKVRVSRAIASLRQRDFVSAMVDPADRRRQALDLTVAGRGIYDQIVPLALATEARFVAGLSSEERRVFEALMDRLTRAAVELGGPDGDGAEDDVE